MSEQLEVGAEITKLARLLNVTPKDLDYLAALPSTSLREFRERATDMLFEKDAERLGRVAGASKMVPLPIAAKAAELAFGPLLCAAVSGLIEPERGVAVATRLPIPFLADVAIDMDPRRATTVIAAMPPRTVAEVGRVLLQRGEYVTMGRFVGVLPEPSLRAGVPVMSDADLLKIAFVLEDKSRLDELITIVGERLPGVIRAAYEHDLWAEALDLLSHLEAGSRRRLGDLAAAESDELLTALVRAADRLKAWDSLLPVTAAMSEPSLARFAALDAIHEAEVLRTIMPAALEQELWLELLPLARHLPERALATIGAALADEDDGRLSELVRAAHDARRWQDLIPIAVALDQDARRRMAGLPVLQDDDVLQAIIATVASYDLWAEVVPLVDALPEATRPRLLGADTDERVWSALPEVAGELPRRVRAVLGARARELGRDDIATSLGFSE